jgi:hypothetical protein
VSSLAVARRPVILAIDKGERLFVGVAHDETRGGLLDGPRRREAAGRRHCFGSRIPGAPRENNTARAAGFNYVDLLELAQELTDIADVLKRCSNGSAPTKH